MDTPTASKAMLFILHGNDPALLSRARDAVREELGNPDVERLDSSIEATELTTSLSTQSLFSDHRLIILDVAAKDKLTPGVYKSIQHWLDTQSGDRVASLLLVMASKTLPAAAKKLSSEHLEVRNVNAPSRKNERHKQAVSIFADQGIQLNSAAALLLIDTIGEEIHRAYSIAEVLTQVLDATQLESKLGPDDISPYVGDAGDVLPWDLTDAVAAGNTALALMNTHRMLNNDRHALVVLSHLRTFLTQRWKIAELGLRSTDEVGTQMGLKGFPAKKALGDSKRKSPQWWADSMELLVQAETDLKGGSAQDPGVIIDILVGRLCRR